VSDHTHGFAPFSARTRDQARLALLILVATEVFVLPSLLAAGKISVVHVSIATTFTLMAGVIAVSARLSLTLLTGLLAIVALVARIVALRERSDTAQIVNASFTILVTGVLCGLILAYVFGKERSTLHRMVGAVAAYLLIAVNFARAYEIIRIVNPEGIDLGKSTGSYNDLLYFSFATLTTLGYGTPLGPFARALVSVEALLGQLYPAILIARLVSLPNTSKPRSEAS
jgi:hypothetical protein